MTRGRQLLYTDERVEEVLAGIATGLTDKDAALSAGLSEDTFGYWMNGRRGAKADFADRVTRARAQRTRLWLGGIRRAAANGDWRAYAELLDRCSPDYRKTNKHEVSGPAGSPIQHEVTMLDDAVRRIAAAEGLSYEEVLAEAKVVLAGG